MRFTLPVLLLTAGAALAQTPPATQKPETVYSDAQRDEDISLSRHTVQSVLAPADTTDDQYARWKHPVCFNVYGLSPMAKYLTEKRMKEIAQQVGAPVDRRENCVPTVLIAFTPNQRETLESIVKVRPWLVPGLGMIRSRTREALPIQAWYAIGTQGDNGRSVLVYDGYDEEPRIVGTSSFTRLNSGIKTEIMAVTIVVDTKSIMGMNLETLADHFALVSLAQARATSRCQDVETIANLLHANCDPAYTPSAITHADIALLTGLYATPDETMQRVQKQLIIGKMRRNLETQMTGK